MNRCAMSLEPAYSSEVEPVLKQGRRVEPEVPVRRRRRHPAARGALEQPLLEQVRLVDVLDRVLLLADRRAERRQADGAAVEARADRMEDLAVQAVEAEVVDLE